MTVSTVKNLRVFAKRDNGEENNDDDDEHP